MKKLLLPVTIGWLSAVASGVYLGYSIGRTEGRVQEMRRQRCDNERECLRLAKEAEQMYPGSRIRDVCISTDPNGCN